MTDRVVLRVAPGPAAVGFTINSLGACLVLLARDLDRPREELVWLSSSFGVGLLLMGAVGPVLLRRGPRPVLPDAGLAAAPAGAAAVAFLFGMAAGRYGAPWLIGRGFPVVPVGCAVVVAGTLAVAVPNAPVPVVVGLVVAGLGTAAFYPVTLARLVRAPGMSVTRGPAFGALASGTAILVAPVVLAALGAALDLRAAYLLAVLPLAAALAVAARREPSWT